MNQTRNPNCDSTGEGSAKSMTIQETHGYEHSNRGCNINMSHISPPVFAAHDFGRTTDLSESLFFQSGEDVVVGVLAMLKRWKSTSVVSKERWVVILLECQVAL